MNELTLNFQFEQLSVRTLYAEQEVWLALIDVCGVLELSNPRMVASKLDEDEVRKFNLRGLEGETWFVNEPGFYHVVLTSRSEKAKPFRRWVTHEVLPSIREKGYYSVMSAEDTIKALAKGMEYDHFMEDVVFPAIEMQDEFTFDKLLEHYCGYPIKTMDDLKKAKAVFSETAKERKQRLSALKYCVNDYFQDDDMYRRISRFKWSAPENRGHYQTIKGVRWFDDFIMAKLKEGSTYA